MGLDMYLTRKIYVKNWDFMKPEDSTTVTAYRNGKPLPDVDFSKISYLEESAAYWRKANMIHHWFVNNVQDGVDNCAYYYVSIDILQRLVDTCKAVLADHDLADALLPTGAGFFFGSTEYDDYYFRDLQSTVDQIEPFLNDSSSSLEFCYHSSW